MCAAYVRPGNELYNTNSTSPMTVVRNICVRMHVPLVPAAATVQVPHLFCSELLIVRLLFEGSVRRNTVFLAHTLSFLSTWRHAFYTHLFLLKQPWLLYSSGVGTNFVLGGPRCWEGWTKTTYRIAENFRWCKFSNNRPKYLENKFS